MRKSLREKERYLELCFADYPELSEVMNPKVLIHTNSIEDLKIIVTSYKEEFRMERAARRIQAFWRNRMSRKRGWMFVLERKRAAAKIFKNWRNTKWVRTINMTRRMKKVNAAITI